MGGARCFDCDAEDTEEESSGVKIIDDDDADRLAEKESVKEGTVEHLSPVEERKIGQKMAVEYPGINAPIPENADKKLWSSPPQPQPAESPRGSKRPHHQISHIHNGGYGLLSPNSHASLWGAGVREYFQREESLVRNGSSGHSTSNCNSRFDGMESYIDVHGSNLYGTSINGNLSVDPAHHWSKRRVIGTSPLAVERTNFSAYNARSDAQAYRYIHSVPSGLASPIRDMFGSPSPHEHISSPSHQYSPHNYHQGGPQGSVFPMGPMPNVSASQALLKAHESAASQAWLKAQSALDALHPKQPVGDFAFIASQAQHLQCSRGPGTPHQLGRR